MSLFRKLKNSLTSTPSDSVYYKQEKDYLKSKIDANIQFLIDLMACYPTIDIEYRNISFTHEYLNKQAIKAHFYSNQKKREILKEQEIKFIHLMRSINYADNIIFEIKSKQIKSLKLRILYYAFKELKKRLISEENSLVPIEQSSKYDLFDDFIDDLDKAIETLDLGKSELVDIFGRKTLYDILCGIDVIMNEDNKYYNSQPRELNMGDYRKHLSLKYDVLFS